MPNLTSDESTLVKRAATLCKADLVTRMVYEFTELQGIMGGYYAEAAHEPKEVVQAIREHYQPTQAGGPIPFTRAGRIVALADKLDTLAGIFMIGQKPTASKDPFALRRAALGVLRICIEGKLQLNLWDSVLQAVNLQPGVLHGHTPREEIVQFLWERLRSLLSDQGISVEVFNAVAATRKYVPADFVSRIEAVRAFLTEPESTQLAAAHKRIRNILKQAGEGDIEIRPDHFRQPEEHALHDALKSLDGQVHDAARKADYTGGLKTLAQLQKPVDAFFDKVMVMAPEQELRANRVALLRQLDRLCRSIADLSCLPG